MNRQSQTVPGHINPIQWQHALAVSRQECARVFRDGGTAAEALHAFGLTADNANWEQAVDLIAAGICARPMKSAA